MCIATTVAAIVAAAAAYGCAPLSATDKSQSVEPVDPIEVGDTLPGEAELSIDNATADLGRIPKEGKGTHEFRITNTGTSPLIIREINSGCRCTRADYQAEPIPPGETCAVTVTFDAAGRPAGYFTKVLRIRSNAVGSPHRLYVKGRVAE